MTTDKPEKKKSRRRKNRFKDAIFAKQQQSPTIALLHEGKMIAGQYNTASYLPSASFILF